MTEQSTTIADLLKASVGTKTGGFSVFIKTYKKCWQVNKEKTLYFNQVIIMDATGEMPADVNVGTKYNPLRGRGNEIKIIVCEIQEGEYIGKPRNKLYIDQYTMPTMSITEYEDETEELEAKWDKTNRGKVRHGVVCSLIRHGIILKEIEPLKKQINEVVEFIMTGE